MNYLREIFQKDSVRRIIVLVLVGLFLYLFKEMLNLLLLTFIFTFLMYSIQKFLSSRLRKVLRVQQRIVFIFLYLAFAVGVIFALYKYVPIMFNQTVTVYNQVQVYLDKPSENPVINKIIDLTKNIDIDTYINDGISLLRKSLINISQWSLNIFLAFILSLFFLLEKSRIYRFVLGFKRSKIAFIYNEVEYFGKKFLNSFGKVIEAQLLIAFINSVLSVIFLWILGFPQVFALGIMIFFLGLIPVAGVIISLIPLCMIAFDIGQMPMILWVLVMIAALHSLESYVLNPKLMSNKTELPVFFTFIILLFSEHFLGVWGLIIGIPIFMFILDLLDVKKESKQEI